MPNEQLTLKIGGRDVSDEFYCDIIHLEVEMDRDAATVFNLNLPLKHGDGKWSFVDDALLSPWAEVEIHLGFENDMVEVFRGFITHIVPSFDLDLSKGFLAIRGMDVTATMDAQEKLKAWPNRKDSDIAREIFSEYNLEPVVAETETTHEETVSTIVQRETDIRFLKRLARRNGFECYVEAGKGFFRPPEFNRHAGKVLAFHFEEESTLMSFKATVNATRPLTAKMFQLDPLSREERAITAEEVEWQALGKKGALEQFPDPDLRGMRVVRDGVAAKPEQMRTLCQTLVNENAWFVEVEGEI
ncbi:MAG: phage late control D family protein, partial [Calditrichaeota bacterium]